MKENKITCEYCGTVYDSTEPCCPLCKTKPETDNYMGDHYDYDERPLDEDELDGEPVSPNGRGGKVAALVVLLALFLGFTGYILYAFELLPFKPTQTQEVTCTALQLDQTEVALTQADQSVQLTAVKTPADAVEAVTFTSSDAAVATVDATGLIQAVGSGTATITAVCGTQQAACTVTCTLDEAQPEENQPSAGRETTDPQKPEEDETGTLELSSRDISFFAAGESTTLTAAGADSADLSWESSDESVATVDSDGYVVAVGPGTATITAATGTQTAECVVRCSFE